MKFLCIVASSLFANLPFPPVQDFEHRLLPKHAVVIYKTFLKDNKNTTQNSEGTVQTLESEGLKISCDGSIGKGGAFFPLFCEISGTATP